MSSSGDTDRVTDNKAASIRDGASRLTRRAVLRAGTVGAAAAGAVTAFPGMLSGFGSSAPELSGLASDAEGAEAASVLDGPIVAHITDVSTGDVSIFVGEREIAYRDPALVQHLVRAAR